MADNKSPTGSSWWQTLPGILTGLAAIITAATGLIVAFNHTSGHSEPATATAPAVPTSAAPTTTTSSSGAPVAATTGSVSSRAIALPEIHQVKLAGGGAVITVLSAKTEPIDADRRSVTFRVRYLNTGHRQANFWSSSFRLIVDDVLRSPTNFLDELVDGDSAKEGDAVFELPVSVKDVVLQISLGDEKSRLPFKLP
jgi:hypothetical protein